MVAPERYVHRESVNGTLFGKRVFADIIKLNEMSSSYIIWEGPKSNDKGTKKRSNTEKKAM